VTTVVPPELDLSAGRRETARAAREARVAARTRLRLGRRLLSLQRSGFVASQGCATVGEFAERHLATSPADARRAVELAAAVERWPNLEGDLLAGRATEEAVAATGKIAAAPALERPGDPWSSLPSSCSTREVRRQVNQRLEEARVGERTVEKTFYVTQKTAEDFGRARVLLSRSRARFLTQGETLAALTETYLRGHDPLLRAARARRMPDTATLPHRRDLPAATVARVLARTGDRCAVPRCTNSVFLHYSHRVAHAAGGDREAENIDRLCDDHHELLHAGWLEAGGTADAPVFKTAEGVVLTDGPVRRAGEGAVGPSPPEGEG
jgi:hypothetical protein